MAISIAIAEDNPFLLRAIRDKLDLYPEFEVVLVAQHGQDLLDQLEQQAHQPDLILMDIEMPTLDGILATVAVKQRYPSIKVVMLTVIDNHDNILRAIQAGANGYLLKEVRPPELQQSILDTLDGGAAMTPAVALKALQLLRQTPPPKAPADQPEVHLTKRELEVLQHLSQGKTSTQIAEQLFRSPKTIRNHIEHIYQKLQAHSRVEAIEAARKRFLL